MSVAPSRNPLPPHQMRVLYIIADNDGVTASQIAAQVLPNSAARSASSSCAQVAWELIRKGLVERELRKRELYEYRITENGRQLLSRD